MQSKPENASSTPLIFIGAKQPRKATTLPQARFVKMSYFAIEFPNAIG
jgi:hypothetical protein